MYCRNCGNQMAAQAVICVGCGVPAGKGARFCQNCRGETDPAAEICVKCGVRLSSATGDGKDWLTTLLLCIFLGGLGIYGYHS